MVAHDAQTDIIDLSYVRLKDLIEDSELTLEVQLKRSDSTSSTLTTPAMP